MARLVSYKKTKDDNNRYTTFGNELNSISNEHLSESSTFKLFNKNNSKKRRKKRNFLYKIFCCGGCCCCNCCDNKFCTKLCCCFYYCCGDCCMKNVNDIDVDDDDYDNNDIDKKITKIKYEMSARDLAEQHQNHYIVNKSNQSTPSNIDRKLFSINERSLGGGSEAGGGDDLNNFEKCTNYSEFIMGDKYEKKSKVNKWNWDDSLRSNSDRFLETLEYDEVDGSKSWRKRVKLPKMRITVFRREEAQQDAANSAQITEKDPIIPAQTATSTTTTAAATTPETNKYAATSPVASRGSDSSDPWPSQSDEDIDRLVALHRNRSSLNSLGVRSDSMASVYSGAGEGRYGTVTVKGQIEFGMQFNYKQGALEIHVVQCKDLAAVDSKRNRSDPYVKLYLLPDKSKSGKRKTKVKKHTLNPIFDETLKFHMPLSSLESRTLWLTVWHSDMFGRNDFLGEVTISLQGKVFDNPQPQWHQLQERSEPFDELPAYKGDIIIGLKFIPPDAASTGSGGINLRKFSTKSLSSSSRNLSKGSLHVLVKEAKNLTPVKANGSCDAFCKSYLLPDKNRSSKQKTPVIKKSANPVWNYTFIYEDITLSELSERALELTLWDHDRLSSNEFLGGVRFSLGTGKYNKKPVEWCDSSGKELSLWQSMINRPNFWVEGCLPLRSSLDNIRITS